MNNHSEIKSSQPVIEIGIMIGTIIQFELSGLYTWMGKTLPPGNYQARLTNGMIELSGIALKSEKIPTAFLEPVNNTNASFLLKEVTIGIHFHWERKEDQQFTGALKFIIEDGKIRVINILPVEDYLKSVISSEMSSTSNLEFLKAHAVISRSWLLAQLEKHKALGEKSESYQTIRQTNEEYIRWYDREDHENFHVCADDHCQRYQGITKVLSPNAQKAIEDTTGIVLTSEGKICDARFSKCCGGVSENFENVWEPVPHPYLVKVIDNSAVPEGYNLNLAEEVNAGHWIRTAPKAFCNTSDASILSQVLNDFDQETRDFYRWEINYTQNELAELILRKTGIDFGSIIDLIPVERGESGRLIKLKIIGTKKTMIIGKELEIRKALSETHLYSSAFVVDRLNLQNNIPEKFCITGAGWGHGVGLCQIGAAVMSEKGYTWQEILAHYFKNADLTKRY